MDGRKVSDCREFPEANCSLVIAGTEDEVMKVAMWHAVNKHGYKDTPKVREELKSMLKDE